MKPLDPRLWRRSAATRGFLIGSAAVGSMLGLLIIAQAWLLSTAIGTVFTNHRVESVLWTLPWLALVFAARGLLTWLVPVLGQRAAAAVKSQFRRDIVRARLQRSASSTDSAGLVALTTQGLDALDNYYAKYLPQLVLAVTVPGLILITLLRVDWLAVLIIALTLPLIPVFMILVGWTTQTLVQRRWRTQARLAHHFADLVAGLPTLQVFGRAKAQAAGLARTEADHRRETMQTLRISFLSALVLELLATLSVAIVAVTVGLRVVDGNLTLTTALFVLILAPEAYLPLRQVGGLYHDSADGLAAADQALTMIDSAPAMRADGEIGDLSQSTIELRGVRVRYPEAAVEVDLTIGPGELVALTGPSGCGKSTALAVLLGFTEPEAGEVLVGGRPGLPRHRDWPAALAWVPQHPALLAGTVESNIRIGAPAAPRARIRSALDRAGGAELSLDQPVLVGGEGLSAGEIRRVALARALLRIDCGGGQLLIMDEPTAGLDADTELAAIAGVRSVGVTTLVVSHRRSVLAAADRVVELTGVAA